MIKSTNRIAFNDFSFWLWHFSFGVSWCFASHTKRRTAVDNNNRLINVIECIWMCICIIIGIASYRVYALLNTNPQTSPSINNMYISFTFISHICRYIVNTATPPKHCNTLSRLYTAKRNQDTMDTLRTRNPLTVYIECLTFEKLNCV